MTEPVQVRAATRQDVPALASLFFEMQGHYGDPVSVEEAFEAASVLCAMPAEGFNPRTLLAEVEGVVVVEPTEVLGGHLLQCTVLGRRDSGVGAADDDYPRITVVSALELVEELGHVVIGGAVVAHHNLIWQDGLGENRCQLVG